MKRFLSVAMLVAAAAFVLIHSPRSAADPKGDEQAVRQAVGELAAALASNDVAALDRIYADDYTLVTETGAIMTKAPRLAAIKSGELAYQAMSFEDVSVRLHGNTAVVVLRATSKVQFKGQDIGGQFRNTGVFVKTKGRWQLVSAQVTRLAVK